MTKIFSLGKNWKIYSKEYATKRPELTFTCEKEQCNQRDLHNHGCYYRTAWTKHGRFQIPIYRWRCPECGQTLSVLPDFLVPWARFVTPVREAAIKRKAQGQGFPHVAQGVVSPAVSGISRRTIKRWWRRHLDQVNDASQWVSGELIQAGIDTDLLRLHSQGVNPTLVDTVRWFATLIQKYFQALGRGSTSLVGYFGFFNTRAPARMRI